MGSVGMVVVLGGRERVRLGGGRGWRLYVRRGRRGRRCCFGMGCWCLRRMRRWIGECET